MENGPLTATQFHPEKSGDAGGACSQLGPDAVSKERAQRRAERERIAATRPTAQAAEPGARRVATPGSRRSPVDAEAADQRTEVIVARRHQTRTLVVSVFTVNVLVWLASGDWALRFLALGLSLLITPIVLILLTS